VLTEGRAQSVGYGGENDCHDPHIEKGLGLHCQKTTVRDVSSYSGHFLLVTIAISADLFDKCSLLTQISALGPQPRRDRR